MAHPATGIAAPPELARMAAFVINRLYREVPVESGHLLHAVVETQYPTEGDLWFWADDNAKVLELLSIPAVWQRWPAVVPELLRFMATLCDGPFIFRRLAQPRLETLHQAEGKASFVHSLMDIDCDLARGIVNLGMRFHDDRNARYVTFTGNYVELTHRGQRLVLDAEDLIDQTEITREGETLVLRHSAPLRQARRFGRDLDFGRVTYTYRIHATSMLVGITAEVALNPDIEVEDVLLTIGQDELSHGGNNVHYSRIVAHDAGGGTTQLRAAAPETMRASLPGCGYYALVQDEIAGFALGIHAIAEAPEHMEGLVAVVRDPGRLHWVVSRHRFAGRHRGGTLRAVEHKAITAGGLYDRTADYERLWREQLARIGTLRVAVDLSISYDYGVEMNAYAKCCATLLACPELESADVTATAMRAVFDRYLAFYASHFLAVGHQGANPMFSRQLAFVILGVETMLRATGDAAYRRHLARLATAMLGFEHRHPGLTGAEESGFLMGISTNRSVYVDCHSAALLALVRAQAHLHDAAILEAIDRGMAIYTLQTVAIDFAGALHKADVVALSWRDEAGNRQSNHAFWNFQAGLTLRLFAALEASRDDGMRQVLHRHAPRLVPLSYLLHLQLARSTFHHEDGSEIRSSILSGETNSETQPWVALALHGHPCETTEPPPA